MRFLFDQSTDRRLAPFLRHIGGSDVTVVGVDYPSSLPDGEVLAIAVREQRILVTEDRDFGELIFRERLPHAGVPFLRLQPMELMAKVEVLSGVLASHRDQLHEFVVVSQGNVRFRRQACKLRNRSRPEAGIKVGRCAGVATTTVPQRRLGQKGCCDRWNGAQFSSCTSGGPASGRSPGRWATAARRWPGRWRSR